MILDGNQVPAGSVLNTGVCVVGGGAAGLTLALEFAECGVDCLLIESGAWADDERTQALYAGAVADPDLHSPTDKYRVRKFGGSTTIWGGRCMPFDPIDFEARPWVPHSGWPMPFEEVSAYYERANSLVEAGRFQYLAKTAFADGMPPLVRGFGGEALLAEGLERFSCPTNFAQRYAGRLGAAAPNVKVLLNSNCVGVTRTSDGAALSAMTARTLGGNEFSVQAQQYVFAAGGLENARLLLAFDLGNQYDVVGRYYMCHIAGNVGRLALTVPVSDVHHGYVVSDEGVYCRRRFSLSADAQRKAQVGNAVARLHFPKIADPSHRSGVLSALALGKRLISYEYGKRLNDGDNNDWTRSLAHLRNIVLDPFDTLEFAVRMFVGRKLAGRKFPSVILRNRTNLFSLDVHGEQEPNPESRVQLGSERDELGMPRLVVDWRYTERDVRAIQVLLDEIAIELKRQKLGELTYDAAQLERELVRFGAYGGHHIGTTRMGADPRSSVVNSDCKVHGLHNVYVAGSSVFATSSQANPTLTIVALALRLSDHLRGRVQSSK